jgi:hypothetical protein
MSPPTQTGQKVVSIILGLLTGLVIEAVLLFCLTVLAWSDGASPGAGDRQAAIAFVLSPLMGLSVAVAVVWHRTRQAGPVRFVSVLLLLLSVLLTMVFLPGYFGLS